MTSDKSNYLIGLIILLIIGMIWYDFIVNDLMMITEWFNGNDWMEWIYEEKHI